MPSRSNSAVMPNAPSIVAAGFQPATNRRQAGGLPPRPRFLLLSQLTGKALTALSPRPSFRVCRCAIPRKHAAFAPFLIAADETGRFFLKGLTRTHCVMELAL